jgi:hypothetical protein
LFGINAVSHEHGVEEMMVTINVLNVYLNCMLLDKDTFFYEISRLSYEMNDDILEQAKNNLKTTLLTHLDSNDKVLLFDCLNS